MFLNVHMAPGQIWDEDSRTVEQFRDGNVEAFHSLYHRYYNKVLVLAQGIVLDAEEAADIAQEVFTTVFRRINSFNGQSKFSTWLYRVTVNRAIQSSRSRKGKGWLELKEGVHDSIVAAPDLPDTQISQALARLSSADRAILTLFYWEELSLQEIAQSMDCNENAAKTRLFRARERFRKVYEEVGG